MILSFLIGVLSLIGGAYTLYQAASLWRLTLLAQSLVQLSGGFLATSLCLFTCGVLSLLNARRHSPALVKGCLAANLLMVCIGLFVQIGDLRLWLWIGLVLAACQLWFLYRLTRSTTETIIEESPEPPADKPE